VAAVRSQRLLSSSWRPVGLCGEPSLIFSKYIGSFCRSRAAGPRSRVQGYVELFLHYPVPRHGMVLN